jgi:hypothetical protein
MNEVFTEAENITPPLRNTTGLTCMYVLMCTPTSQSIDLKTIFGKHDNGHFFTLQADGAKCYVAFASNGSGSISETATGGGATVCWPIPDGGQLPYRPVGGRETATGYATLASYPFLHYKGAATGYLRIYRSSLGLTQSVDQFPPA